MLLPKSVSVQCPMCESKSSKFSQISSPLKSHIRLMSFLNPNSLIILSLSSFALRTMATYCLVNPVANSAYSSYLSSSYSPSCLLCRYLMYSFLLSLGNASLKAFLKAVIIGLLFELIVLVSVTDEQILPLEASVFLFLPNFLDKCLFFSLYT
jgi:hypothetical protein